MIPDSLRHEHILPVSWPIQKDLSMFLLYELYFSSSGRKVPFQQAKLRPHVPTIQRFLPSAKSTHLAWTDHIFLNG